VLKKPYLVLNLGNTLYAIKATAITVTQNQNWFILPKTNRIRFTIIRTIKTIAISFGFILN